ncbi:unannotated protein [freshwater metagenome]|uniref:Unannotated protein n=1 Tax=freshwater metagenome TaxID=449393 RepID=A0A6J7QMQ5_9ZZZZ
MAEEEAGGSVDYAEGDWVQDGTGELVWQPAEGGESISAAAAGYAGAELGDTPADAANGGESPAVEAVVEEVVEAVVEPETTPEVEETETGDAEPAEGEA